MTPFTPIRQSRTALPAHASLRISSPVTGILTTGSAEHRIRVLQFGNDGVVCTNVPGVLPSGEMELRLDDACENRSYVFRVSVSWIEHVNSEEECRVGFALLGMVPQAFFQEKVAA